MSNPRRSNRSTGTPGTPREFSVIGSNAAPFSHTAIVVGGGLAGVAAATALAERGVRVTLIEAESYLGGRVGAWQDTLATGENFEMERGFHAFFRQYYNVRSLLRRVDPNLTFLTPLDDYPLFGPNGISERFSGIPTTPPLNLVGLLQKTPSLTWLESLRIGQRTNIYELFRFEAGRTYAKWDNVSAKDYLDSLGFNPRARQMLFDIFAHSFFNPEETMSAAELIMQFHFYFLGNPEGLVFDVLNEPFSTAFWQPMRRYLESRGVRVLTDKRATSLRNLGTGWEVATEDGSTHRAEAVTLALNVPALKKVVSASPDLQADAQFARSVASLDVTLPFAIHRLWLDRPAAPGRFPFVGTTGLGLLDNVSLYHLFEGESRRYAQATGGSVVELHAYAVPEQMSEDDVRRDLVAQLHALYPEFRDAKVLEERFLMRRDCPSFSMGSHANRPEVETSLPLLTLAGDFVRTDYPSALMERAVMTGFMAANVALTKWGLEGEPIRGIPVTGFLALPPLAREPSREREARAARNAMSPGGLVINIGRSLPPLQSPPEPAPDWVQASPRWISKALEHAQQKPSGGWYVIGASREITAQPRAITIAGRELVVWRGESGLRVAPDACPHMGAQLSLGRSRGDAIVCPWHGLELREKHGSWHCMPAHDDGVLAWVRLTDANDTDVTHAPILPERPARFLDAVIAMDAACEPQDIIANRLDPWHGAWFHGHSFARLSVLHKSFDAIDLRVAYRAFGPLCVEVDARFHCPEPRTIVMTILDGDGKGSVVETHATPIAPGKSRVIEATLATSDRPIVRTVLGMGRLLRPWVEARAAKLWVEDVAYAERTYALRSGSVASPTEDLGETPNARAG